MYVKVSETFLLIFIFFVLFFLQVFVKIPKTTVERDNCVFF